MTQENNGENKPIDKLTMAENELDANYSLIKSDLSIQQNKAIKIYYEVLGYLGLDPIKDPLNTVLSSDKVIIDSIYLTLEADQLMYYIGILSGIRPYLSEQLTDAKARAIYATIWRKFNEVGFRVAFRKDKLKDEIKKLEDKIEKTSATDDIKEKGKKAVSLAVKKHYTESNLTDESGWRTYIWSKIEGEKIRRAELLSQYVISIDQLIVSLKERVRFKAIEKGQGRFGDQSNTFTP